MKFHDGSPLTADDIVFSLNRANGPGLEHAEQLRVGEGDQEGTATCVVVVTTKYPDPLLADKWAAPSAVMSKAWAEKNNAQNSADMTKNEENFATRNAMGTGPFMLKERRAGEKTILVNNLNWWDKPVHNLTEVIFTPVSNPATRVAALKAGDIDMTYEVPPADTESLKKQANVNGAGGPRDPRRLSSASTRSGPELLESNVKGKNPSRTRRCARPSIARSTSRRSSAP